MRIVAIVKERNAKKKKHKHGVALRAYYGLGFRIQGLAFNRVFDVRCWVQGSFPVLLGALCLLKEASGLSSGGLVQPAGPRDLEFTT